MSESHEGGGRSGPASDPSAARIYEQFKAIVTGDQYGLKGTRFSDRFWKDVDGRYGHGPSRGSRTIRTGYTAEQWDNELRLQELEDFLNLFRASLNDPTQAKELVDVDLPGAIQAIDALIEALNRPRFANGDPF